MIVGNGVGPRTARNQTAELVVIGCPTLALSSGISSTIGHIPANWPKPRERWTGPLTQPSIAWPASRLPDHRRAIRGRESK